MADLRTDYRDDILDLTQNTQRKYRMITNDDGTVSFEDVTVYSQIGDSFGAADVNTITDALNNTEGSVRYNVETDMIQIVDANGVWHDWLAGGLQTLDLLTLNAGDWTVSGSATTTFTVNPFTLTSADKNGATSQTSRCKTKDTYDLTGKTKLEIAGTGWHVTFGAVEFINAETGLSDYKYSRSASGNFNEIITLPNLNGKYYIALNSGVYGGAGNTKVTMTVFRVTR